MAFSRKIYFHDQVLVITDNAANYIREHATAEGYRCYRGSDPETFVQAVKCLEEVSAPGVIIEDGSQEAMESRLHSMFRNIDAAGGLVLNEKDELLMIYRRGKWDLPKGKTDEGEEIETCALREVSEETGLQMLSLNHKIADTWHIYTLKNDHILKRTAWYRMSASSTDNLHPQAEEDILEARWVKKPDVARFAALSYEAVRDVLRMEGIRC